MGNLLKMLQCGFVVIFTMQLLALFTVQVDCYSKVSKIGSAESNDNSSSLIDAPRIHHAREGVTNVDLWFPKVFNESETKLQTNDSSDVKEDSILSTGRAIDTRPFPFPINNYSHKGNSGHRTAPDFAPSNHRSDYLNNKAQYVYPSPVYSPKTEQQRPSPKQSDAMDRYTPGEAYAFTTYQLKKNKQNKYLPPVESKPVSQTQPPPQPAPVKQLPDSYIPPKDLYTFPPNTQSIYPPPGESIPSKGSSYGPPAAGPPVDHPSFVGPVNPDVLASFSSSNERPAAVDSGESSSNEQASEEGQGVQQDNSSEDARPMQPDISSESQAAAPAPDDQATSMEQPPAVSGDHHPYHHDHDHLPYLDHNPSSFGSYPLSFGHDHHDHDYKFSGLHGIDAFPDLLYDHDHDHHHDYFDHHHHPPPPPPPTTTTTTTEEPETEEPEPEQPRVKKFSYFYLARSLWYIPLYFTLWFTFYVTYLILQSIGRHKVDLPNHTVSRRSVTDLSHKQTVEKVNRLTEFVMSQIDGFKDKYN